jgi:hypothetical protein
MPSSGMLRRAALVRTNIVFLRSLLRFPVTANLVPSFFLRKVGSYRATRRNNPEDGILHCINKVANSGIAYTYYNCN